jgi:TFIIF-interacting CTD phosphatase-like protein
MTDKKITLLLDLDGTLKTDYDHLVPSSSESIVVMDKNQYYSFLKRPYIEEFLSFAKDNFRLCIGTFSGKDYAHKVLEEMGIKKYFEQIYTWEDFKSGLPFIDDLILIDNHDGMANSKIDSIEKRNVDKSHAIWIVET